MDNPEYAPSDQGRIKPVSLGGRFQLYLEIKSHCGFTTVREMKYSLLDNTAVTKQVTAKWPDIANAVFRIVKNYGE